MARKRAVFSVSNIDCATCAIGIEKRLRGMNGVENVGSSIMLNKIFIDYDESKVGIKEISRAIEKAGYSNYLSRSVDSGRRDLIGINSPRAPRSKT